MNAELENLIKLQEIDLRIHSLFQAKKDLPEEVSRLEEIVQSARDDVDKISKTLEKLDNDKKAAQDAITTSSAALDKSQDRLNAITTNREYDAVHQEIENHKNAIVAAQVKLKKASDEISQLESRKAEVEEQLKTVTTENEPKITELKDKIAHLDSNIAEIEKERNQALPGISKAFLANYEYIRQRRKTGRVLSLVGETRTCAICHKILEPRLISELKRGTKLPGCQSCGSLLIWSPEVSE